MSTLHVSDYPLGGQVEASFRKGARVGNIQAADLATSTTAAKAAVDTRNASLHVTDKNHAIAVKDAIDKVDNLLGSGLSTGGSLDNIYAAAPGGDWKEGSQVGS